jgi:hypothetical protein
MWSIIDKEMTLKECTVYCWAPPDEPFEEDEGSIWSLNYFFFNKERKRVAYIYVRGVPVMAHSPRQPANVSKRASSGYDSGANKRARYWLGDQAANVTNDQDADLEDVVMWNNGNDSDTDFCDDYSCEADDESTDDYKEKPRGMSEEIAASMDMDY